MPRRPPRDTVSRTLGGGRREDSIAHAAGRASSRPRTPRSN